MTFEMFRSEMEHYVVFLVRDYGKLSNPHTDILWAAARCVRDDAWDTTKLTVWLQRLPLQNTVKFSLIQAMRDVGAVYA